MKLRLGAAPSVVAAYTLTAMEVAIAGGRGKIAMRLLRRLLACRAGLGALLRSRVDGDASQALGADTFTAALGVPR